MSTHAVTDYIHKEDISAQEEWCSCPSVSLNLLQHIYNFACNSAVPIYK